jgi:hypothetical protein
MACDVNVAVFGATGVVGRAAGGVPRRCVESTHRGSGLFGGEGAAATR